MLEFGRKNSPGSTGRFHGRGESNRVAGDVELLRLGEDAVSGWILLDDVDLEVSAVGPTVGRGVHSGRTSGGGNVLL